MQLRQGTLASLLAGMGGSSPALIYHMSQQPAFHDLRLRFCHERSALLYIDQDVGFTRYEPRSLPLDFLNILLLLLLLSTLFILSL